MRLPVSPICFFALIAAAAVAVHQPLVAAEPWSVQPLAQDHVVVFRSDAPRDVWLFSPGLARCPSGRLVATCDMSGPDLEAAPGGVMLSPGAKRVWKGSVALSDDRGRTWRHVHDFPFLHARPFVAGDHLYIIGHAQDLMILRSDDWGETWSRPVRLTDGQKWHQAPSNVWYANGHVYLVMERQVYDDIAAWRASVLAPVLMRARVGDDLTIRASWTFASELVFRDAVAEGDLDYFGVPMYPQDPFNRDRARRLPGFHIHPIGWAEAQVVQFLDSDHVFHDPAGRTFHLLLRAHTGGTGYAALAKVVENSDGSMTTMLERAPSGRRMAFVPMPGGHLKFHIVYDEQSELYWLVGSQPTDSMRRPDQLPRERGSLPNQERSRLALYFSTNCIDWCFAGLVAVGSTPKQARHYASMVIDGKDLHILSRSGDERARSAHNGNLITFHTIENFRELIY